MSQLRRTINFKGAPLELGGKELSCGKKLPDAKLIANDLTEVTLSSFKGKKLLISVVPSLDTPVCDMQTKKFNEESLKLSDDIVVLTISMDLPFAQKRWCGATQVNRIITLSDHRNADFGNAFGVLLKDLRLLARSIFIADQNQTLRYIQIVPELTQEPDYAAALKALRSI